MTGKTWVIFYHELLILLKDRQALALLFLMPLILIVFLTMALKDVYLSKVGKRFSLQIVTSGEACAKADSLCQKLITEMKRFEYEMQISAKLEPERKFELAVVLPENLKSTADKLKDATALASVDKIQLYFNPVLDQSTRALVQSQLLLALQTVLIDEAKNNPDFKMAKGAIPNIGRTEDLVMESAFGGLTLPHPVEQTVPAWALFGMFFIVIPMANSMIRDRKLGVFKRLLSCPVSRVQLLAGKVLPFFIVNILQFCLMFGFGFFVLPKLMNMQVQLNFDFPALVVITVVCALAATSYGLMISCLVDSAEQVSAVGALSVVILAILGGIMIPRLIMPEFMQNLAMVSPLYWGLEAFQDIIVRKGALPLAAFKIGVLAAFATVCGLISIWRFRWSEV